MIYARTLALIQCMLWRRRTVPRTSQRFFDLLFLLSFWSPNQHDFCRPRPLIHFVLTENVFDNWEEILVSMMDFPTIKLVNLMIGENKCTDNLNQTHNDHKIIEWMNEWMNEWNFALWMLKIFDAITSFWIRKVYFKFSYCTICSKYVGNYIASNVHLNSFLHCSRAIANPFKSTYFVKLCVAPSRRPHNLLHNMSVAAGQDAQFPLVVILTNFKS